MIRNTISRLLPVVFFACMFYDMGAQDIEQVIKAPMLRTNGGIAFSQINNFKQDSTKFAPDYSSYLSGNLNTNLFGVVDLPFSFAYTNNQTTTQSPQPFNRFSIAPSYKWIKTYAGYTSMVFSPYTLSGHEFLGGGIELAPEKSPLRFSAMYGRLRKAVQIDSANTEPSYKRMGGGVKLGYMAEKADVGVSFFKASDDEGSLRFSENDSAYIKPKDNIAGSIYLNLKIWENISFNVEYGVSVLNEDISGKDSLSGVVSEQGQAINSFDKSTHQAIKSSLSQKTKIGTIGATYERISPNYRTMGAYYSNNDFENITADFSTAIKKFLNLSANAGYQRDNLEKQKVNGSSRFILSANIGARWSKKLMTSLSYSNVQSYVHIKDAYDNVVQTNEFENIDTLSFTQLNMSSSVNVSYALQNTNDQRQNLNVVFAYQEASEQQQDDARFIGSRIYNSMLSYQFSMLPQRINISTTVSHNHNQMPDSYMGVFSYNLSLQKSFYEKIKTSLIGTYSKTFNDEGDLANIINMRATGGYTLQKKHNFNLSVAMVNNQNIRGRKIQYSTNLAYNYIFSFNMERENKKLGFKGSF